MQMLSQLSYRPTAGNLTASAFERDISRGIGQSPTLATFDLRLSEAAIALDIPLASV